MLYSAITLKNGLGNDDPGGIYAMNPRATTLRKTRDRAVAKPETGKAAKLAKAVPAGTKVKPVKTVATEDTDAGSKPALARPSRKKPI